MTRGIAVANTKNGQGEGESGRVCGFACGSVGWRLRLSDLRRYGIEGFVGWMALRLRDLRLYGIKDFVGWMALRLRDLRLYGIEDFVGWMALRLRDLRLYGIEGIVGWMALALTRPTVIRNRGFCRVDKRKRHPPLRVKSGHQRQKLLVNLVKYLPTPGIALVTCHIRDVLLFQLQLWQQRLQGFSR